MFRRPLRGRPVTVTVRSGVARGARLPLDLTADSAYWLGRHQPEVQAALAENVKPGDVVYDVGAHVGFLSVCAAKLGARVFAFEPAGENADAVRRNLALNPQLEIELVEAAVTATGEPVDLVPGVPGGSNYGTTPGSSIPSVTLDAFAESHPPPALIKIDVEGGEADVLRGARRLLAEHRPVVLCDLHGEALRDEVRSLLEGYRVEELGSPWRIVARPAAAG